MVANSPSLRCGFIALVGVPNAGKSTLMNNLVGSKISIVSPKVQTTRNRVLGIAVEGDAQLIFVDTPGIFANPRSRLERAMVAAAWSGAGDADIVALLIDVQRGIDPDSRRIVENLAPAGKNPPARATYLVLNKIDAVRRDKLLALTAELNRIGAFEQTFMVSALTGDGVADLRRALGAALPAGPWVYPEDQLADLPLRLMAAEFTREQLFLQLYQELPYSLNVETEGWTDLSDGSVRIEQVVTVMRDSQKPIVLGKGGQRIKSVRERAQDELARALERPVHLFLHVRVREGWLDDPAHYRDMGLEFNS